MCNSNKNNKKENNKSKYIGKINGTYNDEVRSYGYETLEDVLTFVDKYSIIDNIGYQYEINIRSMRESIKRGFSPMRYTIKNKHSIHNINKYIALNSIDIKILDTEFMGASFKMNAVCNKCENKFKTSWNNIKSGRRCPKCAKISMGKKIRLEQGDILARLSEVHNGTIKCNTTEYNTLKKKMEFSCLCCGNVWENLPLYIFKGTGCPKCSRHNSGGTKYEWIKSSENSNYFTSFKLYKLRLWNNNECFYKIGITFRDITYRFRNRKLMPYNYEIIEVIESADGAYIWDLEKSLKLNHDKYKYMPNIKFGGYTECFSKLLEDS